MLRTLVLSQVICHPPEQLSLVLVDFKGGATFAGLEPLPHTAAIVDNLEDGKGLVDRLHDSILGEIQRRQRVLQRAGNLANVAEYNELRDAGKLEEPLPVLFVVIDEFGELLAAKPEFIDLFVQIGRIGRSIGMHLLLASQRLEEGRLRGLEWYLSYHIGLRTFSAQESRSAIGTPDAHELPPIPGSGYLKVDPDIFERFKAAYVSGTYTAAVKASKRELPPIPMPLELANTTESWLLAKKEQFQNELSRQDAQKSGKLAATSQTTLNLVVSRLSPVAEKTRQIWLPPLPENLSLSEVLGRAELTSNRGLRSERDGLLRIPIGRKDRPLEQWQGPSTLDVSGSGGNVAIMGSPQSGKSNVLKTLISSAALTHTPEELSFYCIDMNGSSLNYLAGLPHVGDVTSRFDEDKMRRLIAEMETFLRDREQLFSTHEISSVEQMRQMHAAGELPELFSADVFLAIDGWATLRKDFDDLAESVQSIAQRGLGFGIHVIFVTGRWADIRLPVQAVIGSRVELELNDALDSSIGRKPMQGLRGQPKGRSVTPDELFTQVALPEIRQPDVSQESSPIGLVRAIADAWQGQSAPQVRMLPESVNYVELLKNCGSMQPAIIGIDEATLNPVRFKLNTEQRHIMIVGDSASGKTNALRVLIEEAIRGKKPGEVMFGVYDLKRSLLGQVPEEFLGEYAGIRSTAEVLTKGIAKELERRLPPANVTIDELGNKSWWTGPEIYIIVDDFELLEGSSNPLRPLVPYFSHAADIGLHLIIARRSAGFSRASYDAVLQGVRESGANGLLLSGEKQEGAIWPKIYLRPLPPGRAQWVNRQGRASMIQIATKIVK